MGRIRLQVQVMPWLMPKASANAIPRPGEVDKFCQPCLEESTVQDLADMIYTRWANLNPGIELNIRHLESYFDEKLDMNDRVGEIFDDRKVGSTGQVIETSIVKVFRYPYDPARMGDPQRFASLMPESSARPVKREVPDMIRRQSIMHGYEEHAEGWRQSINRATSERHSSHERNHNINVPLLSREERETTRLRSLQLSDPLDSRDQVCNLQGSPQKKHSSPYGTPTSLSIVSPNESIQGHQIIKSGIPDSPPGRIAAGDSRVTVDLRREDTKSESPELGDSMFTDMPMVLVDPPLEQIQIDVPASNPSSDVPMPPSRIDHESSVNASAESSVYENDALPRGNVTGSNVSSSSSKQTHSSSDILFAETRQRFNDLRQSSNAIIEPIESDGDTCGQQQSMQSGKIRKLDLGTSTDDSSPRTSSSLVHVSLKGCSTGAVSHNIFDRHDAHSEVPASNHEEKSLALGSTTPSQSETRSSYGQKVNPIDDAAVGQEHSEHFNVSDGVRRADEDIEKNRTREQEVHPKSRSAVQIKVAMPEPEPKSCPTKVTTRQPANREKDQAEKLAGNERSRIAKSQDDHATQAKQEEHKRSCEMQMARDAEKKAKEARETAFRKQAEKAMQAADGAKELKAVKLQRARATPAPTGPRTPISYAKSGQEKDRLSDETRKRKADEVGDKEEAKTREGVIAQENIQGSLDSDPDRIGNTVARNEHQEEAMITDKSKVTKHLLCELRELSASRSLHSSSPIESNSITGQRRSTTPVIPRSLAAKTSTTTQGNLLSSSPLTSKSARDDDTPLRSALKKSNISPRRSVSFVDSTTPTLPAHPSIDRLDRQRSWPAKPLLPLDRQLGDTGNRNPDCVERKALSHVSATPHARAKIQTRLNVIRDKRKGRVVDPPVQTATVENRASMSSSQDENIWYVPLDEVLGGNGSAMAGPSSITPLRRSISSTMNHSAPTPSKIDPDVQTTTKEPVLPTTPAPTLQSLSQPILSSDDKSSARSPPQIVPETYLVSSDSSSEESDLSPEPIASKEVSDPPRASQGSNYSTSDNGATSLQSSTAGPRTSHVNQLKRKATDSLSEDTKRLNSHYSRSSAQPSASRKFPPLDRHGRLPNGTRPAYYKFPKLSKYISDAKSEDLQLQQKPDVPIKVDSAPETSSSSDEDSDSFSDGSDVDPAKIASKAKSRSAFPGLSGLVRIARRMRAIT